MRKLSLTLFLSLFAFLNFTYSSDGYLGVSIKSYTLNSQEGLRIVDVFDDGAAFVAGLEENDFISKVNGEAVDHPYDLKNVVKQLNWGDEITLEYLRNGESFTKDIVLGYKAYTRTYEIIKSVIDETSEEWFFKDSTSIDFTNGEPTSMTKRINGMNETIQLSEYSSLESVPQNFLDVSDKIFIIDEAKRVQAERESTASNIVVIKEIISTEIPTSIINPFSYKTFNVYPNPNNGSFTVDLTSTDMQSEITWHVYDIQGRSIASGTEINENGSLSKKITLDDVASGNYLLYIKSGDKRVSSQFIVE